MSDYYCRATADIKFSRSFAFVSNKKNVNECLFDFFSRMGSSDYDKTFARSFKTILNFQVVHNVVTAYEQNLLSETAAQKSQKLSFLSFNT